MKKLFKLMDSSAWWIEVELERLIGELSRWMATTPIMIGA
jgi:hypothetical protein